MKNWATLGFLILLISSLWSCAQTPRLSNEEQPYTNALIHETSPYLLQHAHNPVNWHAWNAATLEKAEKEQKMLLISVGYAACHWCHVMEHESFEDTTVARIMNEHFICIKIDREERPDVDQVYMTACQLINQRGGWPLNALALPDGRPFYAGTYYTKEQWLKLLNYFVDSYQNNRPKLEATATDITKGIASSGEVAVNTSTNSYTAASLDQMFGLWQKQIDFDLGGYQKSPKFPLPGSWDFMLRYYHFSNNATALEAIETCLDKMAAGGIYDHLAGGFARYSTDAQWKVPHFEKMLYDNAQLISLYAQAYQVNQKPLYKEVVLQTLDWMQAEMTNQEGAFYTSLDADSEGEEGKFYTWTNQEIKEILKEDAALFIDYYACTDAGNWESKRNILLRKKAWNQIAQKHQFDSLSLGLKLKQLRSKMLAVRNKRVRPGLDDKILCAWNAQMLQAYVRAYRAFGQEKHLSIALKNAAFIQDKFIGKDLRMYRNYKNGTVAINGFLDDYAFVISAFIELYQVSFDEQWLEQSKLLTEHCLQHFWDSTAQMFYYTPDYNPALIARKKELTDNVIPGSNSEMANNLFKLSLYYNQQDYRDKALQMLSNVADNVLQNPTYFYNWGKLMLDVMREPYEVAILGNNYSAIRTALDKQYLPHVLLMGGLKEGTLDLLQHKLVKGRTTVYVCQQKACQRPVESASEALKQINE